MSFDPRSPYNDLPGLPPAVDVESKAVLRACIEARAALAALKVAGDLIPNQSVLINSIPLIEAQASSEIENIVTTTDRLFRFAGEGADRADPATKETLRYRAALFDGVASLQDRPLSTNTAIYVCSTIKGANMTIRTAPGTALLNDVTGEVVYTPPEGENRLRRLLADWETFAHRDDGLDPLIRMAIGHYQFEAVHPFTDGNGRTGRILNLLHLVEQGLLTSPILYLSRHIIGEKALYYELLLSVTTNGAWDEWILFMLDAVRETASSTAAKIEAIRILLEKTAGKIRKEATAVYSRELAELIFTQPYCRISDVVSAGLAKRQTASVHLKTLCDIGVLEERKAGREKLFINVPFLELLKS